MSALLDTLLDPERRAECAKHDAPVERIAVQPHYWPQVAWRNADEPRRRRVDPPRASRPPEGSHLHAINAALKAAKGEA